MKTPLVASWTILVNTKAITFVESSIALFKYVIYKHNATRMWKCHCKTMCPLATLNAEWGLNVLLPVFKARSAYVVRRWAVPIAVGCAQASFTCHHCYTWKRKHNICGVTLRQIDKCRFQRSNQKRKSNGTYRLLWKNYYQLIRAVTAVVVLTLIAAVTLMKRSLMAGVRRWWVFSGFAANPSENCIEPHLFLISIRSGKYLSGQEPSAGPRRLGCL